MANTTRNTPDGLTTLCGWLFKLLSAILVLVILALAVSVYSNIAVTALPQSWIDTLKKPVLWITHNLLSTVLIVVVFLLLTYIVYQRSRPSTSPVAAPPTPDISLPTLPTFRIEVASAPPVPAPTPTPVPPTLPPADEELAHIYCSRINQDSYLLTHKGIPSGLIGSRVKLSDVFIPLRFYVLDFPKDNLPYEKSDIDRMMLMQAHIEQQGGNSADMKRILRLARQEGDFSEDNAIDVPTLWQALTQEYPMAFIEGIPGIGKSTLLTRIMLYMARQFLHIEDKEMPELAPTLLPIFVSLKAYATAREIATRETPSRELSLFAFIKEDIGRQFRDETHCSELVTFVTQRLKDCSCLVLLDGLDEVSDPTMREAVQLAIESFIKEQRHPYKQLPTYNRFLITSRVSGYQKKAFEGYPHYLIASLTVEQMEDFLPRWCHANVIRNIRGEKIESEEDIQHEADTITQLLIRTVNHNEAIRKLAEIPFLLTLLAAMQQAGTPLPDRRASLYKVVVKTLLYDRNEAKGLDTLTVAEAHQRIGPLAYEMHMNNSIALNEEYVYEQLARIIHRQHNQSSLSEGNEYNEQQIQVSNADKAEAKAYLKKFSDRSGLFVKRVDDYYDFSHRSFEEYFAALYLLRQVERNREQGIQLFIDHVTDNYDLWREPYLLAVASKSENDETMATLLIRALFNHPRTTQNLSLLLLSATAVLESEPDTIDSSLQHQIADALIQRYTQTLREKNFKDCERIEDVVTSWLLVLPRYMLESLQHRILNAPQIEQRATLKLLAMIMPDILTGSPQIFDTLMPILLAIAGLPAIEGNERTVKPAHDVSISSDPLVRDYAFTVLSVMGRRGPGGLLLSKIREEVEPYLEQLAHYSLDCNTLITPTNIPLSEENYKPYKATITQWISLLEELEKRTLLATDIEKCITIHKVLLGYAEDINYAIGSMIAAMLVASAHSPRIWKQTWQEMLLNQLKTGQDIVYFNSALLWTALFIKKDESKRLAEQLKKDYLDISKQLSASRFIAYIAKYLRDLQDLQEFRDIQYFRNFQDFRDSQNFQYLQDFRDFQNNEYLNGLLDFRDSRDSQNFQYLRDLLNLRDLLDFRDSHDSQNFQYLRGLLDLRDLLFINEIAQISLRRITHELPDLQIDLLLILLGRILQIGEDSVDTSAEQKVQQEIRQIIQTITPYFTSTTDDVRDAALDILRYLLARSGDEIRFVIEGAEQAKDEQVRDAYCYALRYARPLGKSERNTLERMGKGSQVKAVREATEGALSRRR